MVCLARAVRGDNGVVGNPVIADAGRLRIQVGDWSQRAHWIRGDESAGWQAKVEIRRGAVLLVEWFPGAEEVRVSLWAGEPEESPGATVVTAGEQLEGIARVPPCGCGEQGCADASFQLKTALSSDELPEFVKLLQGLRLTTRTPERRNVWDGAWREV